MHVLASAGIILAGYLIGAVPFGLIIGRVFKGIDVRNYGSGKTGATNTLRTLGPGASGIVLLLDAGKGCAAVYLAHLTLNSPAVEAGAAVSAMVGHDWPVYVGFKGGRGVAVGLGSCLALVPLSGASAVLTTALVVAATRYVSLGSLLGAVAAAATIICYVALGRAPADYLAFVILGFTLIIFQHRDNLVRLAGGRERRIGERATAGSARTRRMGREVAR